jgi:serine/threonine-protein kinase RsbW
LVVRIFDWGRPIPGDALANAGLSRFDFDPTDLLEIPEGGMGLSLIASVMDEVTYRSDDGQNVLTLLRRARA